MSNLYQYLTENYKENEPFFLSDIQIEEELGEKATVVATGGLAKKIIPHCKREIILDEELLLRGLLIIYEKNK